MLKFFADMKLVYKLAIPSIIMLAIALGITFLAHQGFKSIDREVDKVTDVTAQRLVRVLQLSNSLNEATISEKNGLVSAQTDDIHEHRKTYEMHKASALAHADEIIKLADTPERKAANEELKRSLHDYFKVADRIFDMALNGQHEEARAFSTTEGRKERRDVVMAVHERVEKNKSEMEQSVGLMETIQSDVAKNLKTISITGIILGLALLFVILRYLVLKPIMRIITSMQAVSEGHLEAEISGVERKDEVGILAKALQVFRKNALEARHLAAEQEAIKRRSAEEQQAALNKMADTFEQSVGSIVNSVASSATQMQGSAKLLSSTAEETSSQASAVSAAANETSTNVETVSAATEELSSSISEISKQIQHATSATENAVLAVQNTSGAIDELSNVASNISQVIELIRQVADQTNLLALNATIEAARAGDAGKGFAVVANEVKELAGATAKATNEIADRIVAMQDATQSAVKSIRNIEGAIHSVNEITGTIASAIVEQEAATREISGNVQQAATGVNEVTSNILGVTQASGNVGTAATQMLTSADALSGQARFLKEEVGAFLRTVRAAA